jgi:hypothetical protein
MRRKSYPIVALAVLVLASAGCSATAHIAVSPRLTPRVTVSPTPDCAASNEAAPSAIPASYFAGSRPLVVAHGCGARTFAIPASMPHGTKGVIYYSCSGAGKARIEVTAYISGNSVGRCDSKVDVGLIFYPSETATGAKLTVGPTVRWNVAIGVMAPYKAPSKSK